MQSKLHPLEQWIVKQRDRRWLQLCVANLRIAIGFAFLPAGLKKLLGQPFTDPNKVGVFHEFLHAFHAAGGLYHLVGALQVLAALLLMTQRFATLGAVLLFPILVTINALCWSSFGIPTIVVVNLMTLGVAALLVWDFQKWRPLFFSDILSHTISIAPPKPKIQHPLWVRCGFAIFMVYLGITLWEGGVYRPKGVELHNPSFYLLPLLLTFPILTLVLDTKKYKRDQP